MMGGSIDTEHGDNTSFTRQIPLMLFETTEWITEFYDSLMLEDILRGCRRVLEKNFAIQRLSLAQHRANDSVVTLYSLDDSRSAPLIGPKIVELELSRLKKCIEAPEGLIVAELADSNPDPMETKYFQQPNTVSFIYAPLLLKDKFMGVLVLGSANSSLLSSDETDFLNCMVQHLALSLENSNIHYMERRRSRQLSMVSDIAKQAVILEDLGEFLQASSDSLRNGFDYDAVQVWIVGTKQKLLLKGSSSKMPLKNVVGQIRPPMVEECHKQNRIICNNCISAHLNAADGRLTAASQLAIPICLRGKCLGILYLESRRLDAFSAEDIDTMEGVASLIASAFDNLHLLAHTQQSNQYMQAILESAKDWAILSTNTQGYVITSSAGSKPIFGLSQQEVLGKDILTLFTDERFRRELNAFISSSAVPTLERLRISQATAKGGSFLGVTMERVYDYEKQPIGFLCIARDVTESVLLQQKLEGLSTTDQLTGLYNQRSFFAAIIDEIERSRRFRRRLTLCFLDLDGFKKYNDTQGHLRGDQALKEAANLMRRLVRSSVDSCYRYGGDEFTIIMPETVKRNAYNVVERIRTQLKQHFQGEITASIGIAEFIDPMEPEELIEKSDRAMYTAKSQGGDCIVVSD